MKKVISSEGRPNRTRSGLVKMAAFSENRSQPAVPATCYVLMPFSAEFDVVYEAIRSTVTACGIECFRADMRFEIGSAIESMVTDIVLADLIVADISRLNPNVLYELGVAHALGKPTILLSQDLAAGQHLPFDISQVLTVKYDPSLTAWTSEVEKVVRNFIASGKSHSNPFEAAFRSKGIRLANHFREPFLWGYEKTYRESCAARVAWVVSRQLYWERMDSSFFTDILQRRILTGERLELVLMPDSSESRNNKRDLLRQYKNIEDHLRIVLIKDPQPFCFLPTEISIYDPGTPRLRAILLEPMAHEGADVNNDGEIAAALARNAGRDLQFHNLKESTFDVALSRQCSERMCHAFRGVWNEAAPAQWHI